MLMAGQLGGGGDDVDDDAASFAGTVAVVELMARP